MAVTSSDLSKAISHTLRHGPGLYELELDGEGWVPLAALLDALRSRGGEWAQTGPAQVERMIAAADNKRHALKAVVFEPSTVTRCRAA